MADEHIEAQQSKKKSVRGYASKVFKESSVSAVSAIVSTGSVPRKVFRVLVFVLFSAGFLYQCIKFLSYILSYPTVVSIEITKPESYLTPAYTFCNVNTMKRSKFCRKYPEKCMKPDIKFCQKYNFYCGELETMIPKEEYLSEDRNIINGNFSNFNELGHDLEQFLKYVQVEAFEEPSGPFPRYREEENDVTGCYSFHSRVNSPLDALQTKRQEWWKESQLSFTFDPEENEFFNPNGKAGVIFQIHSPFSAVNPFENGIFLEPGYAYRITISMQEETLLPYPYKTDCLNYTDIWLRNNKEGPRSQKTCKDLCLLESSIYCFNCSMPVLLYPTEVPICTGEESDTSHCTKDPEELKKALQLIEMCFEKCKDDCWQMKYTYDVSKTFMVPKWKANNIYNEPRLIKVKIDFEDSEVVALHYKPQFQEVEAFSYIGGFIGIWLGVSLVQVADIFESLFRISRYFCRKGTSVCSKRSPLTIHETV